MADKSFLDYVPPNLRPLAQTGYQLLDNVVGFDDDYDTTGELLARSLRENPVGTVSDIASSVKDGLVAAYEDPKGTLSAMGDEFATAFDLLNSPVPEDATREQVGEQLEAVSLLASVVPGYKVASTGLKAGADAVDAGLQEGAYRFVGDIAIPAPNVPPGSRMIVPTEDEYAVMSPEMLENEFFAPVMDAFGEPAAGRRVVPMSEEAREMIRPGGDDALQVDRAADLPAGDLGHAYDNQIKLSKQLSPEKASSVLQHELSHYDAGPYGSNLPFQEGGSSVELAERARPRLLSEIHNRIEARYDDLAALNPDVDPSQDPVVRSLVEQRASVMGMTPREMYELNPGEMLARLAQGNPSTVKRMSALAALNPKINMGQNFGGRLSNAYNTLVNDKAYYARVPMDLGRAQVFDRDYNHPYTDPIPPEFAPGRKK